MAREHLLVVGWGGWNRAKLGDIHKENVMLLLLASTWTFEFA